MGKRIGIFGGSFDPIHFGHLHIAENAYHEFHLDAVIFMPAGHSPNKAEDGMTFAEDRARMTELAIADYPYFYLSRMEINAEGTSYTYLTLSRLKERYPDWQLYFIMGADSLDYFDQWYHPEIICEKAVVLVAVRDNLEQKEIQKKILEIKKLFPAEIYPLSCRKIEASSSEIRKEVQNGGQPLRLPEAVADYIREHRLYLDEKGQNTKERQAPWN
jgi:nicotinate-nucleotide adenylyltransferase